MESLTDMMQMPDLVVQCILHQLDIPSLLRCRLVSRRWRECVDVSGPWVRLTRRLGVTDCDRGLTAERARQLLTLSGVVCAELPVEEATDEALVQSGGDLQLLPRSDIKKSALEMETWMLDLRHHRLLKRRQRIERIQRDSEVNVKFCATSWIALVHLSSDHMGVCDAVPLKPRNGGPPAGGSVRATAKLLLPQATTIMNVTMATHECGVCGEMQLLVLTKVGHLQLWSVPQTAESVDEQLALSEDPDDTLWTELGDEEEGLMIRQVASSPPDADYAVFAILNSNDDDTKSRVTFVRSDCGELQLIRSRIDLGGDECGFLTATDGVLVTMVMTSARKRPRQQQQRQRQLRVTRHQVVGAEKLSIQSDSCLYNIPASVLSSSSDIRAKLIGYGSRFICVSFDCGRSIALYRPSVPQPLSLISLPIPLRIAFPVSDWLDRGLDPGRESCPLLVSVGDLTKPGHLVSWHCAKQQRASSELHPVRFKAAGLE